MKVLGGPYEVLGIELDLQMCRAVTVVLSDTDEASLLTYFILQNIIHPKYAIHT